MKQLSRMAWILGGSVFISGMVLGMIAGAASGILFAPQSGEDTREHLRKQADDVGQSIKDKGLGILDAGKHQVSTALQHGREMVEDATKLKAA